MEKNKKIKIIKTVVFVSIAISIMIIVYMISLYKNSITFKSEETTLLPILNFNIQNDLSPIAVSYELTLNRRLLSHDLYTGKIFVDGIIYEVIPRDNLIFFESVRLKITEYSSNIVTIRASSVSEDAPAKNLRFQFLKNGDAMFALFSNDSSLTTYSFCGPEENSENAEELYVEIFMPE